MIIFIHIQIDGNCIRNSKRSKRRSFKKKIYANYFATNQNYKTDELINRDVRNLSVFNEENIQANKRVFETIFSKNNEIVNEKPKGASNSEEKIKFDSLLNLRSQECSLKSINRTVRIKNCGEHKISLNICAGSCYSKDFAIPNTNLRLSECSACKIVKTQLVDYNLQCANGKTKSVKLHNIVKCACLVNSNESNLSRVKLEQGKIFTYNVNEITFSNPIHENERNLKMLSKITNT